MGSRSFRLFDNMSCDDRITVNVKTKTDVEQAYAEGIITSTTEGDDIELALRPHSDYFHVVWCMYKDTEVRVHIPSGRITVNDVQYNNRHSFTELREFEFSGNNTGALYRLRQLRDPGVDLPTIKGWQDKFCISNTQNPGLSPDRVDYYNRSPINVKISACRVECGPLSITTSSRKCEVDLTYDQDIGLASGAIVKECESNVIPGLRYIAKL